MPCERPSGANGTDHDDKVPSPHAAILRPRITIYHVILESGCLVRHSKMAWPTSEMGLVSRACRSKRHVQLYERWRSPLLWITLPHVQLIW